MRAIHNYHYYIGCVQTIEIYMLKTGLTVDSNRSGHPVQTLEVTDSGRKGARLRYDG